MKIEIVSSSDITGGAARAAFRLHTSLKKINVHSEMLVRTKKSDDQSVKGDIGFLKSTLNVFKFKFGSLINRLQQSPNTNFRSGNWLPSRWSKKINTLNVDIVNLHWIAGESLSIEDIGRINKPIIWTLHDMWPFCGTEHYTNDDANARWRKPYTRESRSEKDSGLDIDLIAWKRKKHAWASKKMHIISPSTWLSKCARESELFKDMPIYTIPNPLDTSTFKPLCPIFSKNALNLPQGTNIILFGAIGGGKDARKGQDLLVESFQHFKNSHADQNTICVIFGESEPKQHKRFPLPTYWLGHIHDDTTLALLYSAASVMVVPSRQENLPQTATEAQSCGCPVVAFNCTGLIDAVSHKQTGYLAQAFDTLDLAVGIEWVLSDNSRHEQLKINARQRALSLWSPEVVIPQYIEVYQRAIDEYAMGNK